VAVVVIAVVVIVFVIVLVLVVVMLLQQIALKKHPKAHKEHKEESDLLCVILI
jgi:uncharacterized membrane protein